MVGIPPFNFPALIPLWMMSVAVACGNTFLLKPAEKAPLTGTRLIELFADAGLPPGVVGVVQGSKEVSERLIANPHVQAVSFVGTSAVAESVYRTAAAHGKRVQAHGGAKNHLIVLPDADLERSLPALIGSCFGSAGQRCRPGACWWRSAIERDRTPSSMPSSARRVNSNWETAWTTPRRSVPW